MESASGLVKASAGLSWLRQLGGAAARPALSAALPSLRRAGRRGRCALRRLLPKAPADHGALLPGARPAVRGLARAGCAVRRSHRRSAAVRPRALGGDLRRGGAKAREPAQVRRPAGARPLLRPADGGAGAELWAGDPVLVPVPLHRTRLLVAALQPVDRAGPRARPAHRPPGRSRPCRPQPPDAAAGRAFGRAPASATSPARSLCVRVR